MTEQEKRRGGGKLSRSETVTVRLDPKLRYLAELAARKQRRTLSSYIEWALEDSLKSTVLAQDFRGNGTTVADEASNLWDVDEADRFAKLALRYPYLLTHDEQVRWKLICEFGKVWLGRYAGPEGKKRWTWQVDEESLRFDALREAWPILNNVAAGLAEKSELPGWLEYEPQPKKSNGFADLDPDIPF